MKDITHYKLDDQTVAMCAAREFRDGMVVNLGGGIPTLAVNFVPEGREVFFHAENGALGHGPIAAPEDAEWDMFNASFQPVTHRPGISFFSHDESFDMIRGGHVDLSVLGAMQVSEKGDLANWAVGNLEEHDGDIVGWIRQGKFPPGIGGAMDLAIAAKRVIVAMRHLTKDNRPKIVRECTYELTARRCVAMIYTDLAVIEVTSEGLVLKEVAPGLTAEEIQSVTEPKLIIAKDIREIQL